MHFSPATHLPRLLPMLAVVLVISGCSSVTLPPLFADSDPSIPEARCRAAGAQSYLGQELDDNTLAAARAAAGGMRTRVLPLGAVATTDSDPMRLNIEIDQNKRI